MGRAKRLASRGRSGASVKTQGAGRRLVAVKGVRRGGSLAGSGVSDRRAADSSDRGRIRLGRVASASQVLAGMRGSRGVVRHRSGCIGSSMRHGIRSRSGASRRLVRDRRGIVRRVRLAIVRRSRMGIVRRSRMGIVPRGRLGTSLRGALGNGRRGRSVRLGIVRRSRLGIVPPVASGTVRRVVSGTGRREISLAARGDRAMGISLRLARGRLVASPRLARSREDLRRREDRLLSLRMARSLSVSLGRVSRRGAEALQAVADLGR